MKLHLASALIASLATAGLALAEPMPIYSASGAFQISGGDAGASLEFLDEQGGETARYDLSGCRFRLGARETGGGDGVFALMFPGAAEPMVAVVCHPVGGGQRFSIFAPMRDTIRAILEVTGESFVRYAIRPGVLVLSRDTGGSPEQALWHSGVEADEGELGWTRELIAAAAGRRLSLPKPVSDPDFQLLAARLAEIAVSRDAEALVAMAASDILISFGGNGGVEELRQILAEPWFWPEFERVLEGGGVLEEGWEDGRAAIFPALFRNWPDDLDAYGHLYGDRTGALLRAGPSDHAPVIAELHGRIVSRGPYLMAFEKLLGDHWVHVCTKAEGCGFAREQDVRSPIGWRGVFVQAGKGAPWVLETYVAGD